MDPFGALAAEIAQGLVFSGAVLQPLLAPLHAQAGDDLLVGTRIWNNGRSGFPGLASQHEW